MGSSRELLCLRWEDFGTHFSSSFKELRKQDSRDSFFDMSLAVADDDRVVQAHKVVLSSCSPFFRNVLARQARASPLGGLLHPVIFLRGISAQDLRNILDFMYHGEVNVAQEDLDGFLAVAAELKIKGLTQGGDEGKNRTDGGGGLKRRPPSMPSDGAPRKRPNMKQTAAAATATQQQRTSERELEVKAEPLISASGHHHHHHHHHQSATPGGAVMIDAPDDGGGGDNDGGGGGGGGGNDGMGYDEGGAGDGAEEDYGEDDYGDFGGDESGDMSYGEDGGQLMGGAGAGHGPGGSAEAADGAKGKKQTGPSSLIF